MHQKLKIAIIIILLALFAVSNLGMPLVVKNLVDAAIIPEVEETVQNLLLLGGLTAMVLLTEFGNRAMIEAFYRDERIHLRNRMMQGYLRMHLPAFKQESEGDRLSALINDVPIFVQRFYGGWFGVIGAVLQLLTGVGALLLLHPIIAVTVILVSLMPMVTPALFSQKMQGKMDVLEQENRNFSRSGTEILQGFLMIKGFSAVRLFLQQFSNAAKRQGDAAYAVEFTTLQSNIAAGTFSFIGYLVQVAVGIYLIIQGELTAGGFIASLQLSDLLVPPILRMSDYILDIRGVKNLRQKIDAICTFEEDETRPKLTDIEALKANRVAYHHDDRHILKDVTYTFEQGKKYAIVGRSGSGKSTFLHVLAGLIEASDGAVEVNSQALDAWDMDSYHENMLLVPQHAFVFDESVKNNITLYKEYPKEALDAYDEALQLDQISSIAHASGGEKQRIAIARAMLRGADVMLFDEATASLDRVTERRVHAMITKQLDTTVISVTHNVSEDILSNYDEVLVMEAGQLVEAGEYSTLMANNGALSRLVHAKELTEQM